MAVSLVTLNRLAAPFLRGCWFVSIGYLKVDVGSVVKSGHPHRVARLSRARNWFASRTIPRLLGLGGTDEQTLCQLILWYRGLPRLPARVLGHWQERHSDFLPALLNAGYDDARSTLCVLCHQPFVGLDWWSVGRITGPCCSHDRGCRQKERGR